MSEDYYNPVSRNVVLLVLVVAIALCGVIALGVKAQSEADRQKNERLALCAHLDPAAQPTCTIGVNGR